ncbi:MAG: exodeoxyribonuclease V subunit gamma, partial [Victivallales bacterium]
MGIKVYGGNRLEDIAGTMAKVMDANRPEDPFQKIPVVIHSSGMARWLRQELAKSDNCGLSANTDLIFPGKFFQKWVFEPMDQLAGKDSHSTHDTVELPFNPDTIKWLVIKALSSGLEKNQAFQSINAYIGNDDDREIRRYQIAGRIARIFDRYMSYRPEMLKRWQSGRMETTEKWQGELWNSIIRSSGVAKAYSNYFWDFMNHDNPAKVMEALRGFHAVYFFGLSAMPPSQFAMLQKVSDHVPVHFFWMNPCKEFWSGAKGEKETEKEIRKIRNKDIFKGCETLARQMENLVKDESGNPLLGSLGRVGRELHNLMLNSDGIEEVDLECNTENVSKLLLHKLQEDILNNKKIDDIKIEMLPNDDSISINNCYGPLREAEALYEFLIRSFDQDKSLLPKDIVVYVPDLENYAPAIEAVFGGSNPFTKKAIPFTIADRTLTREYPSCAAFLAIIKLLGSRFKASEVLAVWGFQEIRDTAGISDDDWDVLQRLLKDAMVAWGIDEAFREKASGCRFRQNSWRFALDRLIFGAVMMDSGKEPIHPCFKPHREGDAEPEMSIAPLEDAEPYSRLIGFVADWMESLFGIQGKIDEGKIRKSSEWIEVLEQISEYFLPSSDRDDGVLAVRRAIGSMRKQLETAGLLDMEISWDLASLWMQEIIDGEANDEKFCCGLLTFCRFQPMRGIPAGIVCMLGMNDGEFPRLDKQLGFDLMDPDPKKRLLCDRWGKDDDRYAFLEALVSARRKLYISYTGRRDTDKQEMPPSILVSELCSYLGSRVNAGRKELEKALVAEHPMHPFSQEYFDSEKNHVPLSISGTWRKVAENLYISKKPETVKVDTNIGTAVLPIVQTVDLYELLKFFDSPCKYYFTSTVGIDLDVRQTEQPDNSEPSEINKLEEYQIRSGIREAYERSGGTRDVNLLKKDFFSRMQAEGILPYGATGRKIFTGLWDETWAWIQELKKLETEAGELLPSFKSTLDIEVAETKMTLTFEIPDLRKNCQLIARPAKCKTKDLLRMAVHQAIIQSVEGKAPMELPCKSVFWGLDMDGDKKQEILKNPKRFIQDLVGIYLEGQKQPLCFWLEVAAVLVTPDGLDEKAAKEEWEPDNYKGSNNYYKPDLYTRKAF